MRWGGEGQDLPAASGDFNFTFAGIIAMLLALIVINFWITMDNRQGRQEQKGESERLRQAFETVKADATREVERAVRDANDRVGADIKGGKLQMESMRSVLQALQDASSLAAVELDKRMQAQLATRAEAKAVADLAAKVEANSSSKEAIDALKDGIAKLDAALQKSAQDQAVSSSKLQEQANATVATLKAAVEEKIAAAEAAAAAQAKRADELAAQVAAASKKADDLAAENAKKSDELAAKVAALEKALAEKK